MHIQNTPPTTVSGHPVKIEFTVTDGYACPVDPMDLLQCDSCQ